MDERSSEIAGPEMLDRSGASANDFGDDWVHEVIAMTRPGVEIQFPLREIDEREIPFAYDDFS
jgi:hypothetical protein